MKLQAQAQTRLHELAEARSLPASQCGQAFLDLVAPLLDSGVLAWRQGGPGRRLVVEHNDVFRAFCRQHFPEAAPPPDAGSRVAAVGRFRDTKALANTENEIITLRVWRDEALLKDGNPCGAAAATAAHGVFSFVLTPGVPYRLHGRCALAENPAVFAAAERLGLNAGLVIYGHGRISHRALEWLARSPDAEFIHVPDYDPSGLSEFQRIRARLGWRAALHLPADLEARFERFSNLQLLEKGNSRAMLAQLRSCESPPEIRRVVALIDRHNAGLEQEALLLDF
jgi:hypothetical protein